MLNTHEYVPKYLLLMFYKQKEAMKNQLPQFFPFRLLFCQIPPKTPSKVSSKPEAGFAEIEDSHSQLISAILTGVNRALRLPFAKISSADVGYV